MAENLALTIPRFFIHSSPNAVKSREQGRPIYDDIECVEITHPGDKQTKKVFPANEVWKYQEDEFGFRQPVTYAMRFPDQYKAFKNQTAQAASGTPIEELPFLSQGKRLELKALNIYTAESLAALDGMPLKQLGMGGRELKNQAQAYLDNAAKNAGVTALAAENAQLKAQLASMKSQFDVTSVDAVEAAGQQSPFADFDEESLKEWIKDATGQRPRGNPGHATLVRMADEINAEIKAKADAAKEAA